MRAKNSENSIGEYILRNGLNQYEFAAKLKVAPGTISRYISGTRIPRRAVALRISLLTGIPILDILYPPKKKKG